MNTLSIVSIMSLISLYAFGVKVVYNKRVLERLSRKHPEFEFALREAPIRVATTISLFMPLVSLSVIFSFIYHFGKALIIGTKKRFFIQITAYQKVQPQ